MEMRTKNPYGTWNHVRKLLLSGAKITINCRSYNEMTSLRVFWAQRGWNIKSNSKTLTLVIKGLRKVQTEVCPTCGKKLLN